MNWVAAENKECKTTKSACYELFRGTPGTTTIDRQIDRNRNANRLFNDERMGESGERKAKVKIIQQERQEQRE